MPAVNTRASPTPNASTKSTPHHRSAASATATTTHSPRASSDCSRPNSSAGTDRGATSMTSNSRHSATSTGSTAGGCTPRSETSHPPSSKPPSTVRSTNKNSSKPDNRASDETRAIHHLTAPSTEVVNRATLPPPQHDPKPPCPGSPVLSDGPKPAPPSWCVARLLWWVIFGPTSADFRDDLVRGL